MDSVIEAPPTERFISYSQWVLYEKCPLSWKLRYIDGIRGDDFGIAALFGTAMHNTIQEWLDLRYTNIEASNTLDTAESLKSWMISEFKERSIIKEDETVEFPCTREEFEEHYDNGHAILKHVHEYADTFFPVDSCTLVGIEVPVEVELRPHLKFTGHIDIILHDTKNDIYKIIDLKTSTKGWWYKDYKRTNQILLYKRFYSLMTGIPEDKIFPEYIILTRNVLENKHHPNKRISYFKPSHGTAAVNSAVKMFNDFVEKVYDDNGNFTGIDTPATPSQSACRFCDFKYDKERCPVGYYKEPSDEK